MEHLQNNCTGMDSKLAELLLEPEKVDAKVQAHVDECGRCREELADLRSAMALLDTWQAPEPSPYFLTRLEAQCGKSARLLRQAGRQAGLTGCAPVLPTDLPCMSVLWLPWRFPLFF